MREKNWGKKKSKEWDKENAREITTQMINNK